MNAVQTSTFLPWPTNLRTNSTAVVSFRGISKSLYFSMMRSTGRPEASSGGILNSSENLARSAGLDAAWRSRIMRARRQTRRRARSSGAATTSARTLAAPLRPRAPPGSDPAVRACAGADHPARFPSEWGSDPLLPSLVGGRLRQGRSARPALPRPAAERGAESGARGDPAVGGDEAHRTQDGERVPTLRDRGGSGPEGGRNQARCLGAHAEPECRGECGRRQAPGFRGEEDAYPPNAARTRARIIAGLKLGITTASRRH